MVARKSEIAQIIDRAYQETKGEGALNASNNAARKMVKRDDMLTAHAFLSTCQLRAKGDDVGESDLPASWKQEGVRLVFKVFSRYFGDFCQII